jgi:hypothetical protein
VGSPWVLGLVGGPLVPLGFCFGFIESVRCEPECVIRATCENLRDPAGLLGFLGGVGEFINCIKEKRSEGGGRAVDLCGRAARAHDSAIEHVTELYRRR